MDAAEKNPWEMTPEAFGKSFAPTRTATHPPGFCYPFADGAAHPTREAAVRSGHRHLVARAIDAGQAVPADIRDLYPDLAKSDFAELATASPNDAGTIGALTAAVKDIQSHQAERDARHQMALAKAHADAQAMLAAMLADAESTKKEAERRSANTQTVLAKCLGETEDALKGIIGATLLAHDDAMTLHRTTATGLAKALEAQAHAMERQAEDTRDGLLNAHANQQHAIDLISRLIERQDTILAEIAKANAPTPPKKWHFRIVRDHHGNIEALDAEQA